MKTGISLAIALLAIIALAPAVSAQSPQPSPTAQMSRHAARHQMMMERRTSACAGKKQGDPCSFERFNEIKTSGTCEPMRGGQLICRPVGMRGPGMHGPMGGGMMPGNPPPQ
jgi:hypothetical protein